MALSPNEDNRVKGGRGWIPTGPGGYFHKAGLWRVTNKYPGKARKTQYRRAMIAAEEKGKLGQRAGRKGILGLQDTSV